MNSHAVVVTLIAADDKPLLEAVTRSFTRLCGGEGKIGIAVSGGPDSMALLALSHIAWPGNIAAATVDHGLRTESVDEAHMVADYCAEVGIDHQILMPKQAISGNIQSEARSARYQLLEQWRQERGCDWLFTAHHADDQLETMLMRLNRGSGVAGLAGIRARNGEIIRPLLSIQKADLIAYCQRHSIPFVDDPSNEDHRFDRARLRAQLAKCDWLDPVSAAQSAAALADAESALHHVAKQEYHHRISEHQPAICLRMAVTENGAGNSEALPHEIVRRIVLMALQRIQPDIAVRGEAMERLIAALKAGETATQGNILCQGKGDTWHFAPAPERKNTY